MSLSATYRAFFDSEKSGGLLLMGCTLVSLAVANTVLAPAYEAFWNRPVLGMSLEHWVNDAFMSLFFLLVGLELERELYSGELSDLRNALLPIIAAVGGILVPAAIHFGLNAGTATQDGAGIPMATDIAFALGVLALLGRRVPASLKIFLTALAVIDDLGAILVIAAVYTASLSLAWLGGALALFLGLCVMNRFGRVQALWPYLVGGALLWFCMLQSGVHATVAGVLLAFAIPYSSRSEDVSSPSHRLEHFLHRPVAIVILPLFALANTGITLGEDWHEGVSGANGLGIAGGLLLGKPLGILVFSVLAVRLGFCRLPKDLRWRHVVGAGLLGGVGFTMSIFIANLAFAGRPEVIDASKLAVLGASFVAGLLGYLWLFASTPGAPGQERESTAGRAEHGTG